jgi:uncharacterized protein YndB with AHSA1/START domain
MTTNTDRIVKNVLLRAPQKRVWQAISDASRFGTWFGVDFDGPFVAGERVSGRIVPTQVDPEVAKSQEPYAGTVFDIMVERIEPMRLFSFRWHPGVPDESVDLSREPTTLVTFELQEAADGTQLTVTESGFDRIPLERRAKVFAMNEQGWAGQVQLIEKYLAHGA